MTSPELIDRYLSVLWAKSRGGFALLIEHLLDAAAVAEIIYDQYFSDSQRRLFDRIAPDGNGKRFFAFLAGVHDIGKATPSFQAKNPALGDRVYAVGLEWLLGPRDMKIHHTLTGGAIMRSALDEAGWQRRNIDWVWPLISGHHGVIPGIGKLDVGKALGRFAAWSQARRAILDRILADLGYTDLAAVEPVAVPTRGEQLAISGFVIMADWISSNEKCRGGVTDITQISMESSRLRAKRAWQSIGLRGGWQLPAPSVDLMRDRFGRSERPIQALARQLADADTTPGLIIVEAPPGEGKTEVALIVAEVLARRLGLSGIFDGLPTQATSNATFTRIHDWLRKIDPTVSRVLAHGKRDVNPLWKELRDGLGLPGDDDRSGWEDAGLVIEWFLGRHRGLLAPVSVGTVDNLLFAATRTSHVALRIAGLSGKVVVLDEVHAYSLYMQEFLFEALRWLGSAGIPVILLSATLPPDQRAALLEAYGEGSGQGCSPELDIPEPDGYPSVTTLTVSEGIPRLSVDSVPAARSATRVAVHVLPDPSPDASVSLRPLLRERLADGGRVLVVRNTVTRAQETYRELREEFGESVALLHSRFTATDRSARTEAELQYLGPRAEQRVGEPHILVATQVAEQSFDIDVDLLVTDVAPIDLLLQRIGRMHRHASRDPFRPSALRTPTVYVTGMTDPTRKVPDVPYGVDKIYSSLLLLRTAALVEEAAAGAGWMIPDDIPGLVRAVYARDPLTPPEWAERVAEAEVSDAAEREWHATSAKQFLLGKRGDMRKGSLEGLHDFGSAVPDDDDAVAAVVRDGPESIEVVLVRADSDGWLTLGGRRLTRGDEIVEDEGAVEEAAGSALRLPSQPWITAAARKIASPKAFSNQPFLSRARPLVLDQDGRVELGGTWFRYDSELGLSAEGIRWAE